MARRVKATFVFGIIGVLTLVTAAPDSAGIVEMVNGLAYGGIPYGSVTGMVAKYPGYAATASQTNPLRVRQLELSNLKTLRPVIITPNYRATRIAGRAFGPVQIYNLPGVVAPGVVGTISQIGY